MDDNRFFIIDFDSTFVNVETLEELSKIILKTNPQKKKILSQVKQITKQGMEGKISYQESLKKRLSLFKPTKESLNLLTEKLKKHITPSIARNKIFFQLYHKNIYIVSGGFAEYIVPVVREFGISPSHVLANSFIFNAKGQITGFDKTNPLSQNQGKVKAVESLHLSGKTYVIGDGFTDYEIKAKTSIEKFYAFIENVSRKAVLQKADFIAKNMDEVLYRFRLPRAYSFPKSQIKILLLENIHPEAVKILKEEGYETDVMKKALSEEELMKMIPEYSLVGIRSKTVITPQVLSKAKRLLAIGAFCIGTNQIDLACAARHGVVVFNAPFSATRSVVELIIGEIIMLSRKVFDKSNLLQHGVWDKSATDCHEIRGKKLGIIGYGNIGSQLSVVAENLGMDVMYYDLVDKLAPGNTQKVDCLEELCRNADVITVHVDGRPANRNLIGEKEFDLMKPGALFLNASRGHVVDLEALKKYLQNHQLAGAAVDVFPQEPHSNQEIFKSPLQGIPNVILTPHIGAGSEEAQKNIGQFVARKIIQFINTGSTLMSVNLPQIQLSSVDKVHRLIHIHKNIPGVMAKINKILAKYQINIEGQYLQTNAEIGYVITDINKSYREDLVNELKKVPETIRLRVLY